MTTQLRTRPRISLPDIAAVVLESLDSHDCECDPDIIVTYADFGAYASIAHDDWCPAVATSSKP